MDSHETLSGGGGGTDPSSAASAQPGSAATALFPHAEHDLPGLLGLPAEKIAAARKGLLQGPDWARIARQFRWSEEGLKNLAAALGCPVLASDVEKPAATHPSEKPAPTVTPGAVVPLTVVNLNIPNQSLIICRSATGFPVNVRINPQWRPLFRHGMKIEATVGATGEHRTRRPRSVGRF